MEGYKHRHEGTRETYNKRKGKRTVRPVPSCSKDLTLDPYNLIYVLNME